MCYGGCTCERCTGPWDEYEGLVKYPSNGRPFQQRWITVRAASINHAKSDIARIAGVPLFMVSRVKRIQREGSIEDARGIPDEFYQEGA